MAFKFAVLILAAGASTRMKRPKQLLPIGNTTLLGNAISSAQKITPDRVICVLGANSEEIKASVNFTGVEIVENPDWERGMGSSIAAGIQRIMTERFDLLLITLCDQPLLGDQHLRKLLSQCPENSKAIVATDYGGTAGVPALFPTSTFQLLKTLKGDKGAKLILNDPSQMVERVVAEQQTMDVDTELAYKEVLSEWTKLR
ncbi:MAG: molybdenum cofactor cytidylyltransferase [Limisphaerales bacterium]|jgi:molybdenum cofactor cytidylyltransferase